MNPKLKKALEIAFMVLVLVLSVLIFIFRDRLEGIGKVSYLWVFLLCFISNATVLLPAPSLMIAASFALILNPIAVAVAASLGSSLGELVGYAVGTAGEDVSPKFRKLLDKTVGKIRNPVLLVFILAALPLPLFDVVGLYSGGIRMNLVKFFLACFAGKMIKMLVYTHLASILEWSFAELNIPIPESVRSLLPAPPPAL